MNICMELMIAYFCSYLSSYVPIVGISIAGIFRKLILIFITVSLSSFEFSSQNYYEFASTRIFFYLFFKQSKINYLFLFMFISSYLFYSFSILVIPLLQMKHWTETYLHHHHVKIEKRQRLQFLYFLYFFILLILFY